MAKQPADEAARRAFRRFEMDSSVDDIRRFLLEQHQLEPDGQVTEALRVTIRVHAHDVEVGVEPTPDPADRTPLGATLHFADWFQQMIRDRGLTQQAAARRLGVSGKTVNRWVRGHTEPRLRELRLVQSVFGATPPL
jgi:DNA-binding XRE family transcriptional regulator